MKRTKSNKQVKGNDPSTYGAVVVILILAVLMTFFMGGRDRVKSNKATTSQSPHKTSGTFPNIFESDPVVVDFQHHLQVCNTFIFLTIEGVAIAVQEEFKDLEDPENWTNLWGTFLSELFYNKTFVTTFWEQKPFLLRNITWIKGVLTLEEITETFDRLSVKSSSRNFFAKKNVATFVPDAEKNSEKITGDILKTMDTTFAINGACTLWPSTQHLCEIWTRVSGLLANINVYVTPPGIGVSAPPHNDRQDVFILQITGSKRWQLFEPKVKLPTRGQIRGKAGNIITATELNKPLADFVMHPGDILYMPRGMYHTTSSPPTDTQQEHSVHFTLGVETETLAYTYQHILNCAAGLAKSQNLISNIEKVSEINSELRRAIEFGFGAMKVMELEEVEGQNPLGLHMNDAVTQYISKQALKLANILEQTRKNSKIPRELIERSVQLFLETYQPRIEYFLGILMKLSEVPEAERQSFWSKHISDSSRVMYSKCGIKISEFE